MLFLSLTRSLQAAIYFKNNLSKRWCLNCRETDPDNPSVVIALPINEQEKATIRSSLIQIMVSSEDVLAKQFIECATAVRS